MASSTGCSASSRVNVFSNPDKKYDGQAQGTDSENNARVLNEAAAAVASFRESSDYEGCYQDLEIGGLRRMTRAQRISFTDTGTEAGV